MKAKSKDILRQNKVFLWIAIVAGLVLLVPLAMTIHDGAVEGAGWNWTLGDFIVMGVLLFTTGSLFVLAARKIKSAQKRIIVGVLFALAFLYVWAELAVGIFTNLGS